MPVHGRKHRGGKHIARRRRSVAAGGQFQALPGALSSSLFRSGGPVSSALGTAALTAAITAIVKASKKKKKKGKKRKRGKGLKPAGQTGAGLRVRASRGLGGGVSVLFPSSGAGHRKRKRGMTGGTLLRAGEQRRGRGGGPLTGKQKKILSVLL